MDLSSEKTQGHLRIEIRKTSKGEYSYDTTASVNGYLDDPDGIKMMRDNITVLLQDADVIARLEIKSRMYLDGNR